MSGIANQDSGFGSNANFYRKGCPLDIVFGTPSAEVGNVISILVTAKEGNGQRLSTIGFIEGYMSKSNKGEAVDPVTTSVVKTPATDGSVYEVVTGAKFQCTTDITDPTTDTFGTISLNVAETGVGTFYVVILDALNRVYVSPPLIFA